MIEVDSHHEVAPARGEVQCPGCMEHIARAEAILADLNNAERELRDARRKITRLENDRPAQSKPKKNDDQTLRKHKDYPAAKEVFDFWKAQVSPRAREFSGKRLQNVIARLEAGYTVKQLKLSVYGAARHPTTLYGTTYNDLELIARDPAKTDDFIARGARALQEDKALGLGPAESRKDHDERRELTRNAG
jgi:hypothetical protein